MHLTNYIESHLLKYIKQSLDDGYSPSAIKHALLTKGHHTNIIDRAILYLEKNGYKQNIRHKDPQKQTLDDEMFEYMVKLISRYIKQQQHDGYELHDIRNALLSYGHSFDVIDHAIGTIQGKPVSREEVKTVALKTKRRESDLGRYSFSLSAIVVFGAMAMMSILSDTSFVKITIAFMPTIIALFAVEGLFSINARWYTLAIPPILCLALKLASEYDLIEALAKMSLANIIGANLLISYAVVGIYFLTKK